MFLEIAYSIQVLVGSFAGVFWLSMIPFHCKLMFDITQMLVILTSCSKKDELQQ